MGVDANGNGQVLGHALIMNETKETLSQVLQIFKEENNECIGLKTVVLDKDFAEISSVSSLLPEANIIICQFHVQQIWQRQLTSGTFCIAYASFYVLFSIGSTVLFVKKAKNN